MILLHSEQASKMSLMMLYQLDQSNLKFLITRIINLNLASALSLLIRATSVCNQMLLHLSINPKQLMRCSSRSKRNLQILSQSYLNKPQITKNLRFSTLPRQHLSKKSNFFRAHCSSKP
ncbi:hypothetical protein FGO68_gene2133 [Halteria grandinella]|uniref:Uncharacterized protein n=1 Tax=Halteria grandinella TaxID=5974 RepID=A0A8J8SXL9_HALGN|nr:hypothetical protein FGO68_gene2133 [Halteria grandinella]